MKTLQIGLSTALVIAVSAVFAQATQIYSFNVLPGASIQFNGSASSFQFNGTNNLASANQWVLTESGGSGAFGLQGYFSGGPWTYGPITTSGSLQYATVNPGTATLTIDDGTGLLATASVVWGMIDTVGTVGAFNANLTVNLSNFSYSGGNADLLNFFSSPGGQLNLNFQTTAKTLTQLSSGSAPFTTSFAGNLTPVPEPASALVLGLGFLILGGCAFGRKLANQVG